jgi:hypothetical protein
MTELSSKPRTRFLLGLGCQKGGSTWLFDYLSTHQRCELNLRKEIHLFDSLYTPEGGNFRNRFQTQLDELCDLYNVNPRIDIALGIERLTKILSFFDSPESYFDYWAEQVEQIPNLQLVGDITPAYAGLQSEQLLYIRENLLLKGFEPRVLFVLRNPIERHVSQAIMMSEVVTSKRGVKFTQAYLERACRSMLNSQVLKQRSDYKFTIENIEAVFRKSEYKFIFYEELFMYDTIRELCHFLGIDYQVPNLQNKVYSRKHDFQISLALHDELLEYYLPQYQFCKSHFGQNVVQKFWEGTPLDLLSVS